MHTHPDMQVESALATQNLKPTIDAIKRLYGDDKDKVQRETSALYKKSGVNPSAGVSPFLVPCRTVCDAAAVLCGVTQRVRVWGSAITWMCAWNHQADHQGAFSLADAFEHCYLLLSACFQ